MRVDLQRLALVLPRAVGEILLTPVRGWGGAPQNVQTIADAVVALEPNLQRTLAPLKELSAALVAEVAGLRDPLDGLENRMGTLESTAEEMAQQLELLQSLDARMATLEAELGRIRTPLEDIAKDVGGAVGLLSPSKHDGPVARLRDALTPGSGS